MSHRYSTPPRRGRAPNKPGAPVGQVQSLTRGLSILEALAKSGGGLTLTDVSQRVQLPPSTTHRFLSTLERMGYVYQAGDLGLWYVGLQAFTVGTTFLANRDFVAQSHASMHRLMEQAGETANLVILDGTEAVFIAQVQCHDLMALGQARKTRSVARSVWQGDLRRVTANRSTRLSSQGLPRITEKTSVVRRRCGGVRSISQRGYSFDDDEHARQRAASAQRSTTSTPSSRRDSIAARRAPGRRAHPQLGPIVAHIDEELTRNGRTLAASVLNIYSAVCVTVGVTSAPKAFRRVVQREPPVT